MQKKDDSLTEGYASEEDFDLIELMNYHDNNNGLADAEVPCPVSVGEAGCPAKAAPDSWMRTIKNNVSLTDITMPGTHDTCATRNFAYAQCQVLSVQQQLNLGIRFLDIRCRHYRNGFPIHHGPVYQNINLYAVLNQAVDFLSTHPTECIVLSIKEEYNAAENSRSFEATLKEHLEHYQKYIYLGRKFPRINEVRGKIVLLSRYAGNTLGVNATPWNDNRTFEIPGSKMKIQDEYKVSIFYRSKFKAMNTLLNEATDQRSCKGEKADWLFINFASGSNGGSPVAPRIIADGTNADLLRYLAPSNNCRFGIIVMDFPYSEVVNAVIQQNGWLI